MTKVVQFEVEDKEYVAIFNRYYSNTFDRNITQCTLVTLPERYVLAGATMCHARDVFKDSEGERIAFRRAVLAYLMLMEKTHNKCHSIELLKVVVKLFQKSMGAEKYKIYGKEN